MVAIIVVVVNWPIEDEPLCGKSLKPPAQQVVVDTFI